jgi:hypothetical protein
VGWAHAPVVQGWCLNYYLSCHIFSFFLHGPSWPPLSEENFFQGWVKWSCELGIDSHISKLLKDSWISLCLVARWEKMEKQPSWLEERLILRNKAWSWVMTTGKLMMYQGLQGHCQIRQRGGGIRGDERWSWFRGRPIPVTRPLASWQTFIYSLLA